MVYEVKSTRKIIIINQIMLFEGQKNFFVSSVLDKFIGLKEDI